MRKPPIVHSYKPMAASGSANDNGSNQMRRQRRCWKKKPMATCIEGITTTYIAQITTSHRSRLLDVNHSSRTTVVEMVATTNSDTTSAVQLNDRITLGPERSQRLNTHRHWSGTGRN